LPQQHQGPAATAMQRKFEKGQGPEPDRKKYRIMEV